MLKEVENQYYSTDYSHAAHKDVSVNDGPHIRRWSQNIILWVYQSRYRPGVAQRVPGS